MKSEIPGFAIIIGVAFVYVRICSALILVQPLGLLTCLVVATSGCFINLGLRSWVEGSGIPIRGSRISARLAFGLTAALAYAVTVGTGYLEAFAFSLEFHELAVRGRIGGDVIFGWMVFVCIPWAMYWVFYKRTTLSQ